MIRKPEASSQKPELENKGILLASSSGLWFLFLAGLAFPLAGLTAFGALGQIQYATGQNVAPAFEGWEQNADGTYSFFFGYLNRNYEEQVDIPIGPNNAIEPGGDRGQ